MIHKLRQIPVEYRALIYRVILALLPILVTAEWITGAAAARVSAFMAAILGVTMAAVNTPRPFRGE